VQRFILPALRAALTAIGAPDNTPLALHEPRNPGYGDLASGVALELAAALQTPPIEIARRIIEAMQVDRRYVALVEAASPGFINIRLTPTAFHQLLEEADSAGAGYGRIPAAIESHVRVQIHAHPPDTLHDARASVLAESIASILTWAGCEVIREETSQRGAIIVELVDPNGTSSERIIQPGAVSVVAQEGTSTIETFDQLADTFDPGLLRCFLQLRPAGMPIAFDPAVAHQHSRSNPYWNVQYAHARIAAIERHAAGEGISGDPQAPFSPLVAAEELALIRTIINLPETLAHAAREYEPYMICAYLGDLAEAIHRLLDSARIIAAPLDERNARLRLLAVANRTLRTQLEMLGVVAADCV
jgi:arginyl-tRNA synthetase